MDTPSTADDVGHDPLDRPDEPIEFASFRSSVQISKSLLVALLSFGTALETYHLVLAWRSSHQPAFTGPTDERLYRLGVVVADEIALVTLVSSTLILLWSLLRSPRQSHQKRCVENLALHRLFCGWSFFSFVLCLILRVAPDITFTIRTHYAPVGPPRWLQHTVVIVLSLGLLASGSMRRGPKMHYKPRIIAGAFGLKSNSKETLRRRTKDDRLEQNVFDWANCSYLGLLFLFYASLFCGCYI